MVLLLPDTTLERNMLMETVYPRLKDYCRERYGLDFQVWQIMTLLFMCMKWIC